MHSWVKSHKQTVIQVRHFANPVADGRTSVNLFSELEGLRFVAAGILKVSCSGGLYEDSQHCENWSTDDTAKNGSSSCGEA